MLEIVGKYNTAFISVDDIDSSTISQLYKLLNSEISINSNIRIMPDAHAGKGCVVGTSMTINDKICPNIVGVDIGCGVFVTKFKSNKKLDFNYIDQTIRSCIPYGFNRHKNCVYDKDELKHLLNNIKGDFTYETAMLSICSLGGGNHFIEINKSNEDDVYYLVIHSGSRFLGVEIAGYYQKKAIEYKHKNNLSIDDDIAYIVDDDLNNYLHDMELVQIYAKLNRILMSNIIIKNLDNIEILEQFSSIHNYIDVKNKILRKGAISAYKNQKLIIPINMRDGSLICLGKGNEEWNCTAPHGAGRLLSRSEAKHMLNINDYKNDMNGIFSTCVSKSTIDESPRAYKSIDYIIRNVENFVDIIEVIKPVYNFKA